MHPAHAQWLYTDFSIGFVLSVNSRYALFKYKLTRWCLLIHKLECHISQENCLYVCDQVKLKPAWQRYRLDCAHAQAHLAGKKSKIPGAASIACIARKRISLLHANTKGTDQVTHLNCQINTFIIGSLKLTLYSIITPFGAFEISCI